MSYSLPGQEHREGWVLHVMLENVGSLRRVFRGALSTARGERPLDLCILSDPVNPSSAICRYSSPCYALHLGLAVGKGTLRAPGRGARWLTQSPRAGVVRAKTQPRKSLWTQDHLCRPRNFHGPPKALALGPGSIALSPGSLGLGPGSPPS